MLECQSCGGRYEPILPDGMQYFHVCPPLSQSELQAAVERGAVVLAKDETVEAAYLTRTYERASKRDENVVPAREHNAPATIKAAGKGAIEVVSVTPPATVVVADV